MSERFFDSNTRCSTLVELLRLRATGQPNQHAFTFLLDGEAQEARLDYAGLDRQARAIAALLQSCAASGERALLLYPPGLEYIAAFFGCLYAGVIAVPAYPPDPSRLERTLPRLQAIAQDAQASVALTTSPILALADFLLAQAPDFPRLRWLATDADLPDPADWQPPAVDGDTVAFLQYTSGSTAAPKGVMLSHANLLHNSALVYDCFGHSPQSQGVIWLPPYHDMGLIGGIIQPLYGGFPVTLLSPLDFLKRPLRWLRAVTRYGATTSGGPNFAYDLCVRKVTAEERGKLDLSCWQLAFNGAEPVRHETMERFVEAFAPCGFRREAFYPCYGLAEATLIVTGGVKAEAPVAQTVDRVALGRGRVAVVSPTQAEAQTLVGCGRTLAGQRVAVIEPETGRVCLPGEVGEVWVAGPSVAQGYWGREEETAVTFGARLAEGGEGPFLRSGDLGFLDAGGELFIAGRLKDLIIIRGQNHYPQDIELAVEQSHPLLRPGCGAAFSVEVEGEERLVVVQEVRRAEGEGDWEAVMAAIRQAVAEGHELQVYGVVLLTAGSIAKTSSGKIQRHASRASFLEGSLEAVAQSVLATEEALGVEASPPGEEQAIRQALLAEPDLAARRTLLTSYLQARTARALRLAVGQVDVARPLNALGLDSLTAVELTHELENRLGVVLPLVELLKGPSLVELVERVLTELAEPAVSPVAQPEAAAQRAGAYPVSHGQRAMWFLHQLAPESAAYHIAHAVGIGGALDVAALQRAFERLGARHPGLRTRFPAPEGEPVQEVAEGVPVSFEEVDARTWGEARLNEQLVEEAHRPFDLEQGPLWRVRLFERGAETHVLLLVVHHIVADFWSLAVLVHELGELYPAERAGAAVSLPPLSLSYADYARWQAEQLAGAEGERLWGYWQRQLGGELPALNLPTDRPRPAVQSHHGASQAMQLGAELTEGLKALSRAQGVTLYVTLLAAFQVLLQRYTGQEDILVGSPTAGRSLAEWAGVVGYFVNPVVLRSLVAEEQSFEAFLGEVRQTVLAAFAHQAYPFDLLVERLQPVRDVARSPVFQAMFIWQQTPLFGQRGLAAFAVGAAGGGRLELGGQTLTPLALEQRAAQFDLTLVMAEVEAGLSVSLQYNSDLFTALTVRRMLAHFESLLAGIAARPAQRLCDLPLLAAGERQQLLAAWNDTQLDYPRQCCLHQLFEAQVEGSPDAVALVYEDQCLTYRALDGWANQVAHHLRAAGLGPEGRVGLYLERSLEMVVGLLGTLKAGGSYVPLDPAHPAERIALVLEDAQAAVLLTQRPLLDGLSGHGTQTVCLDGDWAAIARQSRACPASWIGAENLAYVIYTSGSTGKPKGVQISQRAVVNFVHAMRQRPGLTAEDVLLSVTTLSFDIAGLELFLPLSVGARVVLAGRQVAADGVQLAAQMAEVGATVMQATPATWRLLLETGWPGCHDLTILCGGEAFPRDLANQLATRGAAVWNMYGPTETTIWSAVHRVGVDEGAVAIGWPIANTQLYLLDRHLQPAPMGVPGELYVGGEGLARGYFRRPSLTAAKFIPHPFGAEPGERLYHTGDLARHRSDGTVEFLGRLDFQVKIRGFRIELGDIEAALGQYAAVQEVVVLVREDMPGGKCLVAYVVAGEETAPTTSELRRFLKDKLPEYMMPSAFMTLEALPLTPNGKVNRRALPAPEGLRPELEAAYTAPRTELERIITQVWQEVLSVEKVGIHDNFFDLGGHSLLMARVHRRLRDALQRDLTMVELFQYATVHSLAKHLGESSSELAALARSDERIEIRSARRASMQQQRQRRQKSRLSDRE